VNGAGWKGFHYWLKGVDYLIVLEIRKVYNKDILIIFMGELKNLCVGAIGNRLTLAGGLMTISGLSSFGFCDENDFLRYGVSLVVAHVGAVFLGLSLAGSQTVESYNRAMEHMDDNDGCLDKRYLEKALGSNFYCTRQGVYLAAKDNG